MAEMLAIDTATAAGTIAVGDGERVLAELTLGVGTRHSEALLPAIRFALDHARLEVDHLTGIVVGAGPGSFTGVRIAAATAKGLAFATNLPLYAYSTLLVIAASAAADRRPVCAMIDARRGEVYTACYRFTEDGGHETLMQPAALPLDAVVREMARLRPVFAGNGALRHAELLAGLDIAPPQSSVPRASALLWLAATQPAEGRVASPALWEPEYLRASGAERGVRG